MISLSGLVGPSLLSGLHRRYNLYAPAFLTALILAAAGLVLALIYRREEKRTVINAQ